jgi:hypothetical protein
VERPCFLCGGEVLTLDRATWSLSGLPTLQLGFGPCSDCGLVLQSPAASPDTLRTWYRDQAVYTSPGRSGAPHPHKVRSATRQLHAVEHALGRPAESVFQVGSSDGYTLSRFRDAGAAQVLGLDPSPASVALAHERYGVEARVGRVEELEELPACELLLATHVLEHLWDPMALLVRAREAGERGPAWLAVEVPLFERPDALPPGYLSFEHLTYFTEDSLTRMLARTGWEVVSLDKQYEVDLYPVVAAVARAGEARDVPVRPGERERSRATLERLLERERGRWSRIDRRLRESITSPRRLFLWGGGVWASQLLANTDLEARGSLAGILDSCSGRWGSRLGDHRVLAPAEVELAAGDCVVISSFASESEIWNALAAERERGVHVVRLHEEPAAAVPEP